MSRSTYPFDLLLTVLHKKNYLIPLQTIRNGEITIEKYITGEKLLQCLYRTLKPENALSNRAKEIVKHIISSSTRSRTIQLYYLLCLFDLLIINFAIDDSELKKIVLQFSYPDGFTHGKKTPSHMRNALFTFYCDIENFLFPEKQHAEENHSPSMWKNLTTGMNGAFQTLIEKTYGIYPFVSQFFTKSPEDVKTNHAQFFQPFQPLMKDDPHKIAASEIKPSDLSEACTSVNFTQDSMQSCVSHSGVL